MNSQTFSRLLILITAFAIIGPSSWPSFASADLLSIDQDSKFYPATTCVRSYGPHRLFYDRDGSIFNQDRTRSITVHCPIIRDYTLSDTHLVQATVRIGKANLKKCWLRVIQPKQTKDNNGYKTLARADESDIRTWKGSRYYHVKFSHQQNYKKGALYMLGCELPAKSRMIGYRVLEQD